MSGLLLTRHSFALTRVLQSAKEWFTPGERRQTNLRVLEWLRAEKVRLTCTVSHAHLTVADVARIALAAEPTQDPPGAAATDEALLLHPDLRAMAGTASHTR